MKNKCPHDVPFKVFCPCCKIEMQAKEAKELRKKIKHLERSLENEKAKRNIKVTCEDDT